MGFISTPSQIRIRGDIFIIISYEKKVTCWEIRVLKMQLLNSFIVRRTLQTELFFLVAIFYCTQVFLIYM